MDKSPCCNAELRRYTGGGHILKGYPYESGYYCTACGSEFSDLQIARGGIRKERYEKRFGNLYKNPEGY